MEGDPSVPSHEAMEKARALKELVEWVAIRSVGPSWRFWNS